MVRRGVTALRAAPDDDAELVDQAEYGERLTLLGAREGWSWVQGRDQYCGWVASAHLEPLAAARGRLVVAVLLAPVHQGPDHAAPGAERLPAGSPVRVQEEQGHWLRIAERAWIHRRDTVDLADLPRRAPTPADLIATAEAFLGVPYLWGGTTAAGIDCSGLAPQVYRLNGVALPRNADQQALAGDGASESRSGDLMFFGADRISHVALSLGGEDFLHAPGGGVVERAQIGAGGRSHRFARRILAE